MKLRSSLRLFSFHNAPVFAHWSVLLAFPVCLMMERDFLGALVAQAAFLALMLAHELGHAVVARRFRLPVFSLRLYAIHGECAFGAPYSASAEIAVAWGGVAAQAVVFVVGVLLAKGLLLAGEVPHLVAPVLEVWIPFNALIAFCNLLPIPPLDGAKAWRFVPLLFSAVAARIKSRLRRRPASRVVSMELQRISKRNSSE